MHDCLYMLEAEIIHKDQYGFVKGANTTSAVLGTIDHCEDSIEGRKFTALVFIDLRKAFDTVDHELLVSRLNNGTDLIFF